MIKETDLENIPDLLIKFNEPLSNYTYTKVGGPADILAFPATIEALTELSAKAKATDTPVTVLGNAAYQQLDRPSGRISVCTRHPQKLYAHTAAVHSGAVCGGLS